MHMWRNKHITNGSIGTGFLLAIQTSPF